MPTVDKKNQDIALWLNGGSKKDSRFVHETQTGVNGKKRTYWKLVRKIKFGNTTVDKFLTDKWESNFHEDYNHLMLAFNRVMATEGTWYAIYESNRGEWEGVGKKKKFVRKKRYLCAFTTNGMGRMGYGAKFNNDFAKESIILAMHYSLYRFIKNGKEY